MNYYTFGVVAVFVLVFAIILGGCGGRSDNFNYGHIIVKKCIVENTTC